MSRTRAILKGWDGPRRADLLAASVPPPAFELADLRCVGCGALCCILRGEIKGPRVRRCDKREAKQ